MGQRSWLIELLNSNYLPAIALLEDDAPGRVKAAELATQMRSVWAERGLTKLTQQQSLMDITRRAIKDRFGESHFSLNFIKFSPQEYIQLNNHKQDRVAQRNESIQYLSDPEAIVAQAVALLDSPDWSQVAAGLTVVTGRRSSEILSTAEFSVASGWSVMFTGALKRRGESQILQFEIPTLAPAALVCAALTSLRSALPQAQQMSAAQVNSQFGAPVAKQCDRFFSSLVPQRSGKDNLYTHLFRAVYATIATFWFCPTCVNVTEFKAQIQGHFAVLEETDTDARRSLAASRHYCDYEIADAVIAAHNGQRQGVKLSVPGVEVIQVFRSARSAPPLPGTFGRKHRSSIRVWQEDKPLLNAVLARLGIDDALNQPERFHLLLQWVVEHLDTAPPQLLESATTNSLPVEAPLTTTSEVEELSSEDEPQAVSSGLNRELHINPVTDALLSSYAAKQNYGNRKQLSAGAWTISGQPNLIRSLLKFDIPLEIKTHRLLSATLSLFAETTTPMYGQGTYNAEPLGHSQLSGSNECILAPVLSPWNENTVTWATQPSIITERQIIVPKSQSPIQDYLNIDITQLVKFCLDREFNDGFLMKLKTESPYREVTFHSRKSENLDLRPRLSIYYERMFEKSQKV